MRCLRSRSSRYSRSRQLTVAVKGVKDAPPGRFRSFPSWGCRGHCRLLAVASVCLTESEYFQDALQHGTMYVSSR